MTAKFVLSHVTSFAGCYWLDIWVFFAADLSVVFLTVLPVLMNLRPSIRAPVDWVFSFTVMVILTLSGVGTDRPPYLHTADKAIVVLLYL